MEGADMPKTNDNANGTPQDMAANSVDTAINLVDNPFLRAKLLQFAVNLLGVLRRRVEDRDVFLPCVEALTPDRLLQVVHATCSTELLAELSNSESSRDYLNLKRNVPEEILRVLWCRLPRHSPVKQELLRLLQAKLNDYQQVAALAAGQNSFQQRFADVVRIFNLDAHEADVLLLAYLRSTDMWNPFAMERSPESQLQIIRNVLQLPLPVVTNMLADAGKLRRFRLVDKDFDFNNNLDRFLLGLSNETLVSRYFTRHTGPVLPWSMHGKLVEQHGDILKALLSARDSGCGINVLFHGEPGTGKTAFTASLAAELGRVLYQISQSDDESPDTRSDQSCNFRYSALQLCDAQVDPAHSIILIDEADEMLRGTSGLLAALFGRGSPCTRDKGILNTVLDKLKTPCIWITNTAPEALDLSSRRRFDYSIRFEKLSRDQRYRVWKNAVLRYDLASIIDDQLIGRFAERFAINAGGIDLTLRNCAQVNKHAPMGDGKVEEFLEKLITPHCQLLNIDANRSDLKVGRDYSLDGLNVKGKLPPERILDAVGRFRRQQDAGISPGPDSPRMNILLYGPSGGGKTEFVKYLGYVLDCTVQTRMGGDFLDKYVGGTEQNIREAFRMAEADRAILFIDEADGMLRSRQFAGQSWEVTQVNELLHAMESFNGVLVCATNFADQLDPATLRRFTFKLEFDYLDPMGKLLFYQRMFAELCDGTLSDCQKHQLARIDNLTPGDFRTVRQSFSYLGTGRFPHDELMAALEQESLAKRQGRHDGRRFGFQVKPL
jgi:transitional endoplasmic reticulum ATPase